MAIRLPVCFSDDHQEPAPMDDVKEGMNGFTVYRCVECGTTVEAPRP